MSTRNKILSLLGLLLASTGCSLMPTDKTVSFHQHAVDRAEDSSKKIADRRDQAEFLAAKQRMDQQDYAACREQLENLLARNPKHCEARLLMADLLLRTKQPQQALVQVQEALKYHADDADVQYAMGLTLDVNGRPDEAIPFYERAAKAMPGNEAYALSYRTACEAAERRRSPRGTANARLQPAPPAPAAQMPRPAQPVVAQFETPSGAVPIVATASFDSAAGVAYAGPEEAVSPKPAASTIHMMGENSPQDPQIPVAAATDALKHHNAKLAVDILTPAAARFPDSPAVMRSLGIAHYQTGDFASAQKDLERSLSLDKSSALSYFLMGCTLKKLGQNEAADANLRQAQALDPRYTVQP